MAYSDKYDPRVCFDDLLGVDAVFSVPIIGAVHRDPALALLRRAHERKKHVRHHVVGVDDDTTYGSFECNGTMYQVIGDDAPPVDYPLYGSIYQQYADGVSPKLVRIDDVDTYADFRAARRQPYLDQFEERLSALEAAVAQHVADNHGGGRVDALEEALRQHIDKCVRGGDSIQLPITECATGQVECWQDGNEILCTLRVPTSSGEMRMLTSGTQASEHAQEVVGCAVDEDVDLHELLAVGPQVIQVVGASKLLEELFSTRNEIIDCVGDTTGTVAMVPSTDPALAAAMDLLQRCQHKDRRACAEVAHMQRRHKDLLSEAATRLLEAQQFYGRLS